jgi:hypothetical protein
MEVDSVVEADGYITPNSILGWQTASN